MRNEFTAIVERDGDWCIAYCPEIPGANGQGRTKGEARENLAEAIELILADGERTGSVEFRPMPFAETVFSQMKRSTLQQTPQARLLSQTGGKFSLAGEPTLPLLKRSLDPLRFQPTR
jgi:predicted RNase H-like HicB family nuclease